MRWKGSIVCKGEAGLSLPDAAEKDTVEILCVRMKGKAHKMDVSVGVHYPPLSQGNDTEKLFYK